MERWQSPFDDQGGQVAETLFGMAYGGVLGRGLGEGRPDIIVLTLDSIIGAFARSSA